MLEQVINFDLPTHSKDYIHRVGRTARAGRCGRSITFVTQYDVELYQRIEALIEKKLPKYAVEEEAVMLLNERVDEAVRLAKTDLADTGFKSKRKNDSGNDGDADNAGGGNKIQKKPKMQRQSKYRR